MKSYIFLSCLFVSLSVYGQKGDEYQTNINKAQKVVIEDGAIYIKQADTVIVKVEIVDKKYVLLVDSVITFKDSLKNYFTCVKFISKNSPRFEISLDFYFSDSISGWALKTLGRSNSMISKNITSGNKQGFISGTMFSEQGFWVIIRSKSKITIKLKGIGGTVKH